MHLNIIMSSDTSTNLLLSLVGVNILSLNATNLSAVQSKEDFQLVQVVVNNLSLAFMI